MPLLRIAFLAAVLIVAADGVGTRGRTRRTRSAFFRRTPGCSPFVNSAAISRAVKLWRSKRACATFSIGGHESATSSRTTIPSRRRYALVASLEPFILRARSAASAWSSGPAPRPR